MSGPSPDRLAFRPPPGLLGMLALVAIVEATILGLRDDLVRPLGESWRFAARAAEAEATGSDVLCFGDSLVKYGVLPKVIEARTGLRAYGLACSGGTAPSAYFLLRRALASGARPRSIVVDFEALLPVVDGPPKLLDYPELATALDCLDLAVSSKAPGFFGAAMVAKALPSARLRFEIRDALRAALVGRSSSERASVASHRTIWARERGAQPTEPNPARASPGLAAIDGLCPEGWACPPVDEAYVDRFLDLAGSRGIDVYWLLPPLAPEVLGRRLARGSEASYGRFVRSVAARHPGVVVLDARGSGSGEPAHADVLHLDRRGAGVLSHDIATVLLDRPPGPLAWVEMPPFAGRLGDDPGRALARSPRPPADRRSQGVPR